MAGDDAAYISLGTWGLVGLELDAPVLTEAARAANFTHEGGVDGTIRFLTNVMGTWLLSETLRTWGRDDLGALLAAAADVTGDGAGLRRPGPALRGTRRHAGAHRGLVRGARRARTRRRRQPGAVDRREPRRGVRRRAGDRGRACPAARSGRSTSWAAAARTSCSARPSPTAPGCPVVAGPVEATALGNVLVQGRAAGAVRGGLDDLRALVARTQDLRRHEPRTRAWKDVAL